MANIAGTGTIVFSQIASGRQGKPTRLDGTAAMLFGQAGDLGNSGAFGTAAITFGTAAKRLFGQAGDIAGIATISWRGFGTERLGPIPRSNLHSDNNSARITFDQTGTLMGTDMSTGVGAITFSQTGVLTGVGALAGTAAITFSQAGVLNANIAGTSAITFSQSGACGMALTALAWTGWWNGDNYTATGTATATDQSGNGHNFTEATLKPSSGNALNGHNAITFTSTSFGSQGKQLTSSVTLGTLIGASAMTCYQVVNITAVELNATSGAAVYLLPCILTDTGSYWALGGTDPGSGTPKTCGHIVDNVSADNAVRVNAALNTPHLVEYSHNGTTLTVTLDQGTPVTHASAPVNATGLTQTMAMGRNYNQGIYGDFQVYEILIINSVLTTDQKTAIRNTLKAKYGI